MPQHLPLGAKTASEWVAAYQAGSASPLDALVHCLQIIEQKNGRLNAFVSLRAQDALKEARESNDRWRRGKALSPLDGVPIAIKDNLCTIDMPTTWGSLSGRQYMHGCDEAPIARLRASGAVIVGKTNCPEFTLEGHSRSPLHGTTRNPFDETRTTGGSSSGAAAAVASGMVPLAIGTDGGGSIRRPASHCGLYGLKPSIGTVRGEAGLPSLLLDFEVVGPIALCAADIRLAMRVMSDLSWLPNEAVQRPVRLLWVPRIDHAPVDPAILGSTQQWVEGLRATNAEVTYGSLPFDIGALSDSWSKFGAIGLAALFERYPQWALEEESSMHQIAAMGAALSATELWGLLERVAALRQACDHMFKSIDFVVTPATAALPWDANYPFPDHIDGVAVGPRGHAVYTGWVNAAGLPAISVPTEPVGGLPTGVQVIAARGRDACLVDWVDGIQDTRCLPGVRSFASRKPGF
jgi:aspartyl-tRNA(Asn)/glutamyl-tRNA(Gln) amidotransferase subunit A